MVAQITLYSAEHCPWAQRTRIALAEVGAKFTEYEIDLQNKPEWYAPKINPASKVPTIAYGGPAVPADQPSPESVKIPESAITVEFIADLFPDSGVLPKDPVSRARVRYFVDTFVNKFIAPYHGFAARGEKLEDVLQGVETVQSLLPDKGAFFLGDTFSAAEIDTAPFLGRFELVLKHNVGAFSEAEGAQVYNTLKTDPKYAKFRKWAEAVLARPSVKSTLPENKIVEGFKKRFVPNRK